MRFTLTMLIPILAVLSGAGARQLRGEGGSGSSEPERQLNQGFDPRDPQGQSPSRPDSSQSPTTPAPTDSPTQSPTTPTPTDSPTNVRTTQMPTNSPTPFPTTQIPTESPTTLAPTKAPSPSPTTAPTHSPTQTPTTLAPTDSPTHAPPTPAPTTNPTDTPGYTVFVTFFLYTGDLGGLEGADAKCQESAEYANLPGVYKAWLSTADGTAPVNRFNIADTSRPFRLVDGTMIANSWADLLDGELLAPINIAETGDDVSRQPIPNGKAAWTATAVNGEVGDGGSIDDCDGWTNGNFDGTFGDAGRITARFDYWTDYIIQYFCSNYERLYCFQQSD